MKDVLFYDLAREWWERYMLRGSVSYAEESWRRLECEVMPKLAGKSVKRITPPMVLAILRRIEARGTLVAARKIKSHISQIMRYGIACGIVTSDPTRDLGWALTPHQGRPRPALIDPRQIGRLMADIERYRNPQRRASLKLATLFFVRPGELCRAAGSEIDWYSGFWRIPAAKMKMKRPHAVPTCQQSLDVLRDLHKITGNTPWLFPSRWDKSRHEKPCVLNLALRRMGYTGETMVAHGFRAMAATTLSDMGWSSELIERQLAHVDKNQVRAAYQRSELIADRRKMMQAWADFLDLQCAKALLGR